MNDRILHSLLTVKYLLIERRDNQKGASAVEYGLLVAGIAAVVVGVVFGLGTLVKGAFTTTSSCMAASGTGC